MSDLLEDDLEFRGGTLQLSSENANVEARRNQRENTSNSNTQVNPSVLSGADSLTSSSSSFAGKKSFLLEEEYKIYCCYKKKSLIYQVMLERTIVQGDLVVVL